MDLLSSKRDDGSKAEGANSGIGYEACKAMADPKGMGAKFRWSNIRLMGVDSKNRFFSHPNHEL